MAGLTIDWSEINQYLLWSKSALSGITAAVIVIGIYSCLFKLIDRLRWQAALVAFNVLLVGHCTFECEL